MHGSRFLKTEDVIDKILTATSVYGSTDVSVAKLLGVTRKRIAATKRQRNVFDKIALIEEGDYKESVYLRAVLRSDML